MKILWLTRDIDSQDALELKSSFEKEAIHFNITSDKGAIDKSYDLVIASNYDQVLDRKFFDIPKSGIFVIHSSDLPKGRGWAPIYHSIANGDKEFVLSLIKIDEKVDAGNIIIKIRIKKPLYISNDNLRQIDQEATVVLVKEYVNNIHSNSLGKVQDHPNASYNPKRTPQQNRIDSEKTLKSAILEILATNKNYPAFIELDGNRIELQAKTMQYQLKDLNYTIERF